MEASWEVSFGLYSSSRLVETFLLFQAHSELHDMDQECGHVAPDINPISISAHLGEEMGLHLQHEWVPAAHHLVGAIKRGLSLLPANWCLVCYAFLGISNPEEDAVASGLWASTFCAWHHRALCPSLGGRPPLGLIGEYSSLPWSC